MARFDTSRLPAGVWFVRSGKGGGLVPVTPEGRRVMLLFLLGMLASGAPGGGLTIATRNLLWLAVAGIGMAASAIWFIITARRHGDSSVNYTDILVRE
jgi:hypothetical protein